jgi:hypothetical protein
MILSAFFFANRFHKLSYRTRSYIIAVLMTLSYVVVAFSDSLAPQVGSHPMCSVLFRGKGGGGGGGEKLGIDVDIVVLYLW